MFRFMNSLSFVDPIFLFISFGYSQTTAKKDKPSRVCQTTRDNIMVEIIDERINHTQHSNPLVSKIM